MSRPLTLAITRTAASAVRLPFEDMAHAILPAGYDLSLVICGDTLARKMNARYRKKTYRPNVLSFPLSQTEGEIFLNVRKAEREARVMGISARERIAHLFVHGCAHLAGYDHSNAMDTVEQNALKKCLR